jgi:AraC-like DNA-binding protein
MMPVGYRRLSAPISGSVAWAAWGRGPALVVPDGHADLVWTGGRLLVAGYDTTGHWTDRTAAPLSVGIRLGPGRLAAIARMPAAALVDQRVPLGDLVASRHARLLEEQVDAASDAAGQLDRLLAQLTGPADDALAAGIRRRLAAGTQVTSVAAALGWSTRRMHRYCVDHYGFGPKLLQQILRFHYAYGLLRSGTPAAAVAARCGFSDQAHLSRTVQRFAGSTPSQLRPGH